MTLSYNDPFWGLPVLLEVKTPNSNLRRHKGDMMSVSWVRLLSSQKGHLVHNENISVCRQILLNVKVHTRPFFYTTELVCALIY